MLQNGVIALLMVWGLMIVESYGHWGGYAMIFAACMAMTNEDDVRRCAKR